MMPFRDFDAHIFQTRFGAMQMTAVNNQHRPSGLSFAHQRRDFAAHAGYCRNAFPEADGDWLHESNRLLSDELLDQLLGA